MDPNAGVAQAKKASLVLGFQPDHSVKKGGEKI